MQCKLVQFPTSSHSVLEKVTTKNTFQIVWHALELEIHLKLFGDGNVLLYALTTALGVGAQLHAAAEVCVYTTARNTTLITPSILSYPGSPLPKL